MTKQESLNKAAQEFGYENLDDVEFSDCEPLFLRAMDIYAWEQYNEGINDCYKANEKANILLAGLREKSKYNEAYNQAIRDAAENAEIKEIINNGRPPKFIINKDSILQLLK